MMNQSEIVVGMPVYHDSIHHSKGLGYVSEVKEVEQKSTMFLIGGSGLQDITHNATIVYEDGSLSEGVDGVTVLKDYERAVAYEKGTFIGETEVEQLKAKALEKKAKMMEKIATQRDEADRKRKEREEMNRAYLEANMPKGTKALIIATYHIDDCDIQTDYWGYKTGERVLLGYSQHTRNLFPEMRKAAANLEGTKYLSEKPFDKEHEHRENYSMGGGMYLGVWRNRTGYVVRKEKLGGRYGASFDRVADGLENKKARAETKIAAVDTGEKVDTGGATVEQHYHTKRDCEFYIVVMGNRVERDDFVTLRGRCKAAGGWYSRKWGKTPGGFAFLDRESADEFAGSLNEQEAS